MSKSQWKYLMVMQNFDESVSDHPFMILIIGSLRLVKANALLSKGYWQKDIGKIFIYVKDWYEWKYQLLFNKKAEIKQAF